MEINLSKNEPDGTKNNQRLYNPYKDLKPRHHKFFELPTQIEPLFHEETVPLGPNLFENMTMYTGCGYLAGAVSGVGKGFHEGVKSFEQGDNLKVRASRILSCSAANGRQWGNRAGVVGLMFAGIDSGIVKVRGTDDVWNNVVSGIATGVACKAASGPRAAAVAGAIGGVVGTLAIVFKGYAPLSQ